MNLSDPQILSTIRDESLAALDRVIQGLSTDMRWRMIRTTIARLDALAKNDLEWAGFLEETLLLDIVTSKHVAKEEAKALALRVLRSVVIIVAQSASPLASALVSAVLMLIPTPQPKEIDRE